MGLVTPALRAVADGRSVVIPYACLASAGVGDLVYFSPTIDDTVIVATDNTHTQPVIGVIKEKSTSTTCKVIMLGEVGSLSGLTKGEKVFLSATGGFTNTPPAADYVQTLGKATSATNVYFNPQLVRVLRV